MRLAAKAFLPLLLGAFALGGCSNEADGPSRALLDALGGLGLRKATYKGATLMGDDLRVSGVSATDLAGEPVAIDEIHANRSVATKDGWSAASVTASGVRGGRFSAESVTLVDVSARGGAGGRAPDVGSYRAKAVKATFQGLPVEAPEITGSWRGDGGDVSFAALAAAGDAWTGSVRVAPGPVPGTALVAAPGLRSSRSILDVRAVLAGATPREAMAYVLSPAPVDASKVTLREAAVSGSVRGLPQGVATPDPAGFRDPRMRALAEAVARMASGGLISGGIGIASGPGVPLAGLLDAARAPDAYEALAVRPEIERMPQDVARALATALAARPGEPPRAP